jgi:branched-chain amino acid transport system ATP-binding protein
MANMLDIKSLSAGYGAAVVLHGVSLHVAEGEMVALVGANGAGKTTLLKTISGLLTPRAGSAELAGKPLSGLSSVARVQLGLAHVPEGRQIFGDLSVAENLEIGAYTQLGGLSRDELAARAADVYRTFPILKEREHLPAGGLSGGQQQMLAIGRGLMLKPKLLLLDEPSLGLAPLVCRQIFEVVRRLNKEEGLSVFLVEQDAHHALKLADRAYVMVTGAITMQGPGRDLLRDPKIRAAYLEGGGHG